MPLPSALTFPGPPPNVDPVPIVDPVPSVDRPPMVDSLGLSYVVDSCVVAVGPPVRLDFSPTVVVDSFVVL